MTRPTQPDHAPATERVRLVRAILATLDDDALRRDVVTTALNLGRAIGRAARYSTAVERVLRGQRQTCDDVRCVVAAWDLDAMPALAVAVRACYVRRPDGRLQPLALDAILGVYWLESPASIQRAIADGRAEGCGYIASTRAVVEELEGILRAVGGEPAAETYYAELARAQEQQTESLMRAFGGAPEGGEA